MTMIIPVRDLGESTALGLVESLVATWMVSKNAAVGLGLSISSPVKGYYWLQYQNSHRDEYKFEVMNLQQGPPELGLESYWMFNP